MKWINKKISWPNISWIKIWPCVHAKSGTSLAFDTMLFSKSSFIFLRNLLLLAWTQGHILIREIKSQLIFLFIHFTLEITLDKRSCSKIISPYKLFFVAKWPMQLLQLSSPLQTLDEFSMAPHYYNMFLFSKRNWFNFVRHYIFRARIFQLSLISNYRGAWL